METPWEDEGAGGVWPWFLSANKQIFLHYLGIWIFQFMYRTCCREVTKIKIFSVPIEIKKSSIES